MIDLLYVTHNRVEFTKATWGALLANTDWSLVRRVRVVDDSSVDGTYRWLSERAEHPPVPVYLTTGQVGGPVAAMNVYLDEADKRTPAAFVKLDNDVMVPDGWLGTLLDAAKRYPNVALIGFEAGFGGAPQDGRREVVAATHIGGVGLMRRSAFEAYGRPEPRHKRFGFTEWQQEHGHEFGVGWLSPDIASAELSRVPAEPWEHLSRLYIEARWQRRQGSYHPDNDVYWRWFCDNVGRPTP